MDYIQTQEWKQWERAETLAYIVHRVDTHLQNEKTLLVIPSEDVSDEIAWDAAWKESLQLLRKGFAHLREGFQGGAGALETAVEKASVRRSFLAAALQIPVTHYEGRRGISPSFETGYAEARFFGKAMIAALAQDAIKSQGDLLEAVAHHVPYKNFGMIADTQRPRLRLVPDGDDMAPVERAIAKIADSSENSDILEKNADLFSSIVLVAGTVDEESMGVKAASRVLRGQVPSLDVGLQSRRVVARHILQQAGALTHAFVKACELMSVEVSECPRPEPVQGVTPGLS